MLRGCPVRVLVACVALALGAPACGGDDDAVRRGWTAGRVMAKTDQGYCVSPDRGTTTNCVPLDQAEDEAEVGQCVRITDAPKPADVRLTVVDEAACAAGDLGDDAPSG